MQMVKCATEDSCDNAWIKEYLDGSARVDDLFPHWTRQQRWALLSACVLEGVVIASSRGLLLALIRPDHVLDVFTIFGERGFLQDALRVWRDLYPGWAVRGRRRGCVRLFTLKDFKQYGTTRD